MNHGVIRSRKIIFNCHISVRVVEYYILAQGKVTWAISC